MSDTSGENTPVETGEQAGAGQDSPVSDDRAIEVDAGEAAALGTAGRVEPADAAEAAAQAAAVHEGAVMRIAELEAEKARLEEEKQDTWNRLLRATADLDNFRKRARRDADDARYEARTRILKEMLPVIDNLERAVEHAGQAGGESGIVEGVQLVLRQFAQALERCEVTVVDAQGKPFDPNVHEALSQAVTSEHPPGSVVQVLQRGYKIGDRLLRPALVVVAKAPPEPAPEPAGEGGAAASESGRAGQDSAQDSADEQGRPGGSDAASGA
jgi:molecular chaperone GrpE